MFIIPGAMLIGFGVGLIVHHWIAGTIIGLGSGLILSQLFSLPLKMLRKIDRMDRR